MKGTKIVAILVSIVILITVSYILVNKYSSSKTVSKISAGSGLTHIGSVYLSQPVNFTLNNFTWPSATTTIATDGTTNYNIIIGNASSQPYIYIRFIQNATNSLNNNISLPVTVGKNVKSLTIVAHPLVIPSEANGYNGRAIIFINIDNGITKSMAYVITMPVSMNLTPIYSPYPTAIIHN